MKIIKIYPRKKKKPRDTEHCSKVSIKYSWNVFCLGRYFPKTFALLTRNVIQFRVIFLRRWEIKECYLGHILCYKRTVCLICHIFFYIFIVPVYLLTDRPVQVTNSPSLLYTPLKSQNILIMIYMYWWSVMQKITVFLRKRKTSFHNICA